MTTRRTFLQAVAGAFAATVLARMPLSGAVADAPKALDTTAHNTGWTVTWFDADGKQFGPYPCTSYQSGEILSVEMPPLGGERAVVRGYTIGQTGSIPE